MNRSVLIVSDNEDIHVPLWHALERAGVSAEVVPPDVYSLLQLVSDRLEERRDSALAAIVDAAGRQGAEIVTFLRDGFPDLFVLAAFSSPEVAETQMAVKAGARDFLVHPFDEDQIAACLRLWGVDPVRSSPGRLACFLPARAGDGASTVALHVAEAAVHERLARGFSGRVLLVDLDFQCGNVGFRLQLSPQRTLADALRALNSHGPNGSGPQAAEIPLWRDCVCPWRQIDVLASPLPGAGITAEQLGQTAELLSSARARYPFVVCDLPPAMHSCSKAVLQSADEVCVVCTPEITSLHLARRRVEELQHAGVEHNRIRLVLNRTGSHPWIDAKEVTRVVGLPVSATLANDYASLHAAILKGAVISRRSPLGRQFGELARQTLGLRTRAAAA